MVHYDAYKLALADFNLFNRRSMIRDDMTIKQNYKELKELYESNECFRAESFKDFTKRMESIARATETFIYVLEKEGKKLVKINGRFEIVDKLEAW